MKYVKRFGWFGIVLVFASVSFSQPESNWKISDYLRDLPAEYKTFSGDFQTEPNGETTLIDEKNGYAAFFDRPIKNKEAFPIFEMALFKKANGDDLLVVSNMLSDPVCTFHHTFFLKRTENGWINVEADVMPKLPARLFFDSAKTSNYYIELQKKLDNSPELDLYFAPPRNGTTMKVSLDICDFAPDNFPESVDFEELKQRSRMVSLIWDKKTGIFKIK